MKMKRFAAGLAVVAVGVLALVWRSLGSTINYTYDGAGRLTSASYTALTNVSYVYDNAGNLLLETAPRPAILIGSVSAGEVTLSWPALPAGYVLQRATSLAAGDWSDLAVTTTQAGGMFMAAVPAGSAAAFYRLRSAP